MVLFFPLCLLWALISLVITLDVDFVPGRQKGT